MNDSSDSYKKIFKRPEKDLIIAEHKKSMDQCIGPPYFIFRPAKTEKQRIEETIEVNKYLQSEPSKISVNDYDFRDRIKEKEIQPSMKFKSIRAPNILKTKNTISIKKLTGADFHFKSAFSLMFTPTTNNFHNALSSKSIIAKHKKVKSLSPNCISKKNILKNAKSQQSLLDDPLPKVAATILNECNYINR